MRCADEPSPPARRPEGTRPCAQGEGERPAAKSEVTPRFIRIPYDPTNHRAISDRDQQNARIEHERVLKQIIANSVADHAEHYQNFEGDPSFKQWQGDRLFGVTHQLPASG